MPEPRPQPTRRDLLITAPLLGAALILPHTGRAEDKKQGGNEDVSTNEDLMREHGILKRVLLAYDEIIRRIHARQDFSPQSVIDGATIIRKFVEDYHEKLEEDHLFPRFRKAGKLTDLVNTLLAQHQAGRRVTDRVLATAHSLKTDDERNRLAADLAAFNRMYAPHEAAKIPSSFRRCTRSSRHMSTTRWESSSRRSNARPSAAMASTSISTKSPHSRSN